MSLNRKIFNDSIAISLLGIVATGLGLLSVSLSAKYYGTSIAKDAYVLALLFPITVSTLITGILKIVFVPLYSEERMRDPDRLADLVGACLTYLLLVSLLCTGGLIVLALSEGLTLENDPSSGALIKILLLEMTPLVPFAVIGGVLSVVYNCYQRFILAEMANLARYVILILFLVFLARRWNVHALAIGQTVGYAVMAMVGVYIVRVRLGLPFRLTLKRHPALLAALPILGFPVLTIVLQQTKPFINRFLARELEQGTLSALDFAEKLSAIPVLLIGTGFTRVLISHWSKCVAEGKRDELSHSLNRALSMLVTVLAPAIAGLWILRESLVGVLLQRGAFTAADTEVTAGLFCFLAAAVLPNYLQMVVGRVLMAQKDFRRFFVLNAIEVTVLATLAYVLAIMLHWQAQGIVVGVLAAKILFFFGTVWVVHRHYVPVDLRPLVRNTLRCLVGIACMVLALLLVRPLLTSMPVLRSPWADLLVSSGIGGAVYAVTLLALRHPDALSILRWRRTGKPARPPAPTNGTADDSEPPCAS